MYRSTIFVVLIWLGPWWAKVISLKRLSAKIPSYNRWHPTVAGNSTHVVSCSYRRIGWLWGISNVFFVFLFVLVWVGPDQALEPKWQWLCNGRLSAIGPEEDYLCRRCPSSPTCRYVCGNLRFHCISITANAYRPLTCIVSYYSSGACHDHGPSVRGSLLCWDWHRPWTQVSKRGGASGLLQSAKLHCSH